MSYLSEIAVHRLMRQAVVCSALCLIAGLVPLRAQSFGPAKVLQMTGQVSVLRGNATWALNLGDVVQPQQVIVTGPDGSATFQVSDGSTIEVFPNSRFVFRDSPGDLENLLRLLLGRVRVEIQHLSGGQPNRNTVRTPTAVVSVRGTIFDVTVEDDQGTTLVLVEEGRVRVRHLIQGGDAKELQTGEWVEVFVNQPLASMKGDHGAILQQLARAAKETAYEILLRTRQANGTGTGTSGGGQSTDKQGNGTPPPPPPPPPPPAH